MPKKRNELKAVMSMKMDINFVLREFVFAEIGISDEINTKLSHEEVMDTFIEYAHENHSYDEKNDKIILEKNFAVKINTEKFDENSSFILEFYRYYHRFYAAYITIAAIGSIIIAFLVSGTKPGFFALVLFLTPLPLIWIAIETIREIRGIKKVDYSKKSRQYFPWSFRCN